MKAVVLGFVVLCIGFGIFFFTKKRKNASIRIVREGKKVAEFEVEVADDLAKRAKGLMFREDLADDEGMWFVFPNEKENIFWMKNTYIPLDMIFVNSDMEIVGVIENAEPESTKPLTIGKPSRYILEVNGGRVEELGIEEGDKIKI